MKKTMLVLGILCSAMLSVSTAPTVHAETISEAVAYLLKAHPELRSQSYNRLARDQEVLQAKAGYLPTIDVVAGAGVERQHQPFYDTAWPTTTTISLRQNVFRFFGTQSEVERQEARVRSQAYLLHASSENTALMGTKVYLNVLRNQRLYELSKENLVNHQRIYDQVKLRSESGVDKKADFDMVSGRMSLAQSNVIAGYANLLDAKTDYQSIIGHLPGNLVVPASAEAALPASQDDAERLAIAANPTLMSAKADLEARNSQHKTAKSQIYPSIDVAMNYKWTNDVDIPGRREGFQAMAFITFNIFNGGWNKSRLSQTAYEIREAEEIMSNTKRQTVQSIRLSWEAYRAVKERVAYLEEYVKSAQSTADAYAAQWSIGRRTMFDLLDTQAEAINAKASLENARFDKLYAEYRVLNGISKLVPHLGQKLPDQAHVAKAAE